MLARASLAAVLWGVGILVAGSPLTHEAIWLMTRVGAPVPSPDGKWVVFSVTEPAYNEKNQVSDLWIVPADRSGKPRRLTFSKGPEDGAEWSPDSRRLVFTAKREGDPVPQVYLLDLAAGGEAVRMTSLSTGASAPRFSPDGTRLLFESAVYPGAADDAANRRIAEQRQSRKYKVRIYEGFPIRNWDHWLDDRQPHLFVQAAEPGAPAKDLLAGTKLAAEAGFGGVESNSGQSLTPVWAPDGGSVVFVATTERNRAAYADVSMHLFQVPVAGGESRKLTGGEESFSKPAFGPGGKALYCLAANQNQKVYNLDRLVRFRWPSMDARTVVTEGWDRSVASFALAPDGGTVYMLAEESGLVKLFRVAAGGGAVRPAIGQSSGVYSGLAIPLKTASTIVIANWQNAVSPAEVVRIDAGAWLPRHLTDFNTARARGLDWQGVEHFWFTSKAGKRIHNLLTMPPGFDPSKKYPLVTLIHGGPHGMSEDQFFLRWNPHLLAAPGYVVIQTNYTGSTGFGEKFAQDIQGDPFVTPASEINEAVEEAARRYPFIDGTRVAAAGASYGGHLVNWLEATTTRYRCLIAHAGLINLESQWGTSDTIYQRERANGGPVWEQGKVWREQNPIRHAMNFRTPILLSVGENDFRVPLNQTLENWSVLQRLRVPSRLLVFPDENHWISKGEDSRLFYEEVHAWLKRFLKAN
jgi:dipeptidyl aminopeptidase/acylaminoacyl peptidase